MWLDLNQQNPTIQPGCLCPAWAFRGGLRASAALLPAQASHQHLGASRLQLGQDTDRSCHYFGLLLMVQVFDWQGVPYKTTMPIFKDGYCLTAGSRCAVNWEMVQLLFVMPVISCFLKGCCGDCCCCCCSILYKGYTQQLFPVARWQSLDEPCIAHDILKHKG